MTPAPGTERPTRSLLELVDEIAAKRHIIMVSNRGPVEYQITQTGNLQPRRSSGGVVTALSALTNYLDFTWVASAMGEGDRRAVQESDRASFKPSLQGQRLTMRYVVTPRRVYHKYYNILCNPLLWFLQHYMWSSAYTPNIDKTVHDAWETGYVAVNKAFAKAVVEEASAYPTSPYVMVHDYHLYLVPGLVRKERPDALIHHFIHIPWPPPSYWQLLPANMRQAICESLCAADIVGFQTVRDTRSFLEACATFLPQARTDHANSEVYLNGQRTQVRAYPISIDVEEVRRIATSSRAWEYEQQLRSLLGEYTIIRVDRAEPSKNIVRGFRAFELLLQRYPEFRGRVKFLAFIVPSRTHIRQYQRYLQEIENQVQNINGTYSTPDWQPVTVFYENNYTQAIAGMRLYDILLVNCVIDGMNLVAKEGPVVNTRDGVLILSETAGAHEQLYVGSISVAPADLEGTMEAIHRALTMSAEERAARIATLTQAIETENITHWLQRQLTDICSLIS